MSPTRAVCFCLHDDYWFLEPSIKAAKSFGDGFAFINTHAWNGTEGPWERCAEIAAKNGLEVIVGNFGDEQAHRQHSLQTLREKGYKFVLTPDGDEIVEPDLLNHLAKIAKADLADRVHVHMDTYWKSVEYVIRPPEKLTPLLMLEVQRVQHHYIREYSGGRQLILGPEYGILHHLSYAGPDERIQRKIATWGHKNEVVPDWYSRVWKGWDEDKLMKDLHPTHPSAYAMTERIHPPKILDEVERNTERAMRPPVKPWPKVSVSIPLCGNPQDIRLCLESLEKCKDLLHEVFVVDNASKDGAELEVKKFKWIKLLRNKENLGFAKASNQGYEASTGDVVLFLNSDTVVPKAGFIQLINALMSATSIGAAGPYTNEVGHSQRIHPTYQSLETLDLFAEDFAGRDIPDEDAPADMLVGFCLACRRSVLEEVGAFDENFGLGSFEDNDLCYRMRRTGYRLVVASTSYIHHFGSRTLTRLPINPWALLAENDAKFRAKWSDDIETGFASHLPGFVNGQVVFDPNKSPEKREAEARRLAKLADISLCMIVRNEERVLADCLKSAKPFFKQVIVIDTGSTDRTIDIAKSFGADVHEMVWSDSFAAARNESLKYATGKWIFWLDADDTLPWQSGASVLNAAINSPKEVVGYVVPVQFVDSGQGAGTRVDHVKLFRNLPGAEFEGRIHEQNLGFLRATGGEIARLDCVVLHSGYDTSVEGQQRKRQRDEKLLKLDLAERPEHPFVLFNLGMTAHYTEDHEGAIKWLKASIANAKPEESHLRKAYALLAISERKLGNNGESLSTLLRGLREVGDDPELHFQCGMVLADMGRIDEAKQHYLAVGADISGHFSSIDMGILGPKRFQNLGSLSMQQHNYPEAKEWFQKALEADPGFVPSAVSLFTAAMDSGDYKAARATLNHLEQLWHRDEQWYKFACVYQERVVGTHFVEQFLLQEIENSPAAIGPRLTLARKLLGDGRDGEAIPHLQALVQRGCAEAAFFLGISCIRAGDLSGALAWMDRANVLNPGHESTIQQMENLRAAIASAV